ncbi:MAG: uracil-DNA glycosylase family protein, partial [Pseudomonadota bacterium]
ITNAVRCVPPQNKPVGAEINACRPFLIARIGALPRLRALLCLGRIAQESTLRALGARPAHHPFAHGARHDVAGLAVFVSYHCSRYNTNTGRLTVPMFEDVFAAARSYLDAKA